MTSREALGVHSFCLASSQKLYPLRLWLVISMQLHKKILFLILFFLAVFFLFTDYSQAAECRLINVLTDKNRVGPGERMQVNVTARSECIGRTASVNICDPTGCAGIASQTFGSRTVSGQEAINPAVFFIIPSDFFNQNTTVTVRATVPLHTAISRPVAIVVSEEEPPEDILPGNVGEEDIPDNSGNENALSGFPGEDLEANDVINIVIGLSCWLTRVAFTLAVIFVIWVGFKFMAAQGNQTKYGEAVTSFKHVLWGVLVIYGVYVIIATVAHAVGSSFSFIPLVC